MSQLKQYQVNPPSATWTPIGTTSSTEQLVFSSVQLINTSATTPAVVTVYRRLTADTRGVQHAVGVYSVTLQPVSEANKHIASLVAGLTLAPSSTLEVYADTANVTVSASADLSTPS